MYPAYGTIRPPGPGRPHGRPPSPGCRPPPHSVTPPGIGLGGASEPGATVRNHLRGVRTVPYGAGYGPPARPRPSRRAGGRRDGTRRTFGTRMIGPESDGTRLIA
eukprot:63322-Hanusia_phi.AAC.1